MILTARDTVTGATVRVDEPFLSVFVLAEGNDNCDYNRLRWFEGVEGIELPDDSHGSHVCQQAPGNRELRFRIVEVHDWREEHPEDLDYLNQ